MSAAKQRALVVVSSVEAIELPDSGVQVTRKFLEGLARYAELWNGPVRAVCVSANGPSSDLDLVPYRRVDWPFDLHVRTLGAGSLRPLLADAGALLATVGYQQNHLAELGEELGIPVIYVSELSLFTRVAIARAEVQDPLRLARRTLWEVNQEHRQRASIRRAAGIQCNGPATFNAYRTINRSPILYFDTRADSDLIATNDEVERRLVRNRKGPLRLVFSGRLIPIKGAEHLVEVARSLVRREVDFRLDVYGDGESRPGMEQDLERSGLRSRVKLHGAVDFATELVPRIREESDLFVCCHLQGDPSCTYLETMACGVPVVGYGNEALTGILDCVHAGKAARVADVEDLADLIEAIAHRREQLVPWSRAAVAFGREHCFERTFERRVAHMAAVAEVL